MLSSFGIFVLVWLSFCFLFGLKHFPHNHINSRNEVFMKLFKKTSSHPHLCQTSSFPKVMGLLGKLQLEVNSVELECEDRLFSWASLHSRGGGRGEES